MLPPNQGQLFRRIYVPQPAPLEDSPRARTRLLAYFKDPQYFTQDKGPEFAALVERDIGVPYPQNQGVMGRVYRHTEFFNTADITDLLSALTLWHKLERHDRVIGVVRTVFAQEGLRYRIDDEGGVHLLIDEAFEQLIHDSIVGLNDPRFTAARHELEGGLNGLAPGNLSGKLLIRGVFAAVESAFLAVINAPNVNRINAQSINAHLRPLLLNKYAALPNAADKVDRHLALLNAWVHEAHPYRHGAPAAQIHEAPLELALANATAGMGFLRFIATLV